MSFWKFVVVFLACMLSGAVLAQWAGPEPIDDNEPGSRTPKVAGNQVGQALAVWRLGSPADPGDRGLLIRFLDVGGSGWGPSVEIEDSANALSARPAINDAGDAVVAWRILQQMIRAAVHDSLSGSWADPERLDLNTGATVDRPRVAMDPAGNAVVIWQEEDEGEFRLWAAFYDASDGQWSAAQTIDDQIEMEGDPRAEITVDGLGHFTVIFRVLAAGGSQSIHATRLANGATSWSSAETISEITQTVSGDLSVSASGDGQVVAVWLQRQLVSQTGVWVNRYDPGQGGWQTAENINSLAAQITPVGAIDGAGNVFAAYRQYITVDEDLRLQVFSRRWDVAQATWLPEEMIYDQPSAVQGGFDICIDADDAGNAILAFMRWIENGREVPAVYFDSRLQGWGQPQTIDAGIPEDTAFSPDCAMIGDGHGVAVWQELIESDSDNARSFANIYNQPADTIHADRFELQ